MKIQQLLKRNVNIALLLLLTIVSGAGGWTLANDPEITGAQKYQDGMIVAYYENDYQRYAIDLLIKTDRLEQWTCLWEMWTQESNWRPEALNKTSHAMGIAQLMPTTWKIIGVPQTTDGYAQVDAGLLYISRHYGKGKGNICKAYAHHLVKGWY
jgi:hypothetical protein